MTSRTAGSADPPWWRANAYVALALSALMPGAGQFYAGERRRGYVLLGIATALGLILLIMLGDGTMWLRWAVEPTALRWLLAGNGALLAFRVFAAADAFVAARPPSPSPSGQPPFVASALIAISLVVVALPHAWAGYLDVKWYDSITHVFPSTAATEPAPFATAAPGPLTSGLQAAATGAGPETAATTGPGPPGTPAPTTTTIPVRIWDGTERLNVLLLGGDGGRGRTSIRTDTIILASIDPESGHTALFSVPRNMARVPMPESIDVWDCDCFPGIINALWRWADDRPNRFPDFDDPGSEVLMEAIGTMVGLEIHHYALVNLAGFVEIIDAIGGVEITVPRRLFDERYTGPDGITRTIDIAAGDYHMDGEEALAYARSRRSSNDYNRMGRQRCVLQAVAAQSSAFT